MGVRYSHLKATEDQIVVDSPCILGAPEAGQVQELTGTQAVSLLPVATASVDGKMTKEQVTALDAVSEITPASHAADYVPQWHGANTGNLKEGLEAVEQWITATPTPTTTGIKGQRYYSNGYMYECVDTNIWTRYAVETTWE